MDLNEIIIEKKKFWRGLMSSILTPILMMFLFISIVGIFRENREIPGEVMFFLFLFIISIIGFRPIIFTIRKLLSIRPELKITKKELIVFDNPQTDTIPLSDILDLSIYRYRTSTFLRLNLKEESSIKSNRNRLRPRSNDSNTKEFHIILDFANINPEVLLKELKNRMTINN